MNDGFQPVPGITSTDPNVSFLRNGNHFPDSGPPLIALHEAALDPFPTNSVSMNFTTRENPRGTLRVQRLADQFCG